MRCRGGIAIGVSLLCACARGGVDGSNDQCAAAWCDGGADSSVDVAGPGDDGAADQSASPPLDASEEGATDAADPGDVAGDDAPTDAGAADATDAADSAPDAVADAAGDAALDASDGGCGPLDTVQNCSACGAACDTLQSVSASCTGTTCQYQGCKAGWADCTTTAPDLDGCETATATPTNCAGCGNVCDTATSLSPSCNGTTCQYQGCAAGWADCTTTAPDLDGCETPTTTTANCDGCGHACDTQTGTASCTGASCTYACNAGRSDCNQATAPDLDGCECATPGCCGSSCQFTHIDGLGQDFYDCVAPSTYNVTQATEACTAFTGNASQCATISCKNASAVCSATSPTTCACWGYSAGGAGHVHDSGVAGQCYCPSSTDPAWD